MALRLSTASASRSRTESLSRSWGRPLRKTTLLRLLAGFNHPSSGEIRIGEQVVANRDYVLPPNERFISMVFQSLCAVAPYECA